MRCTLNKPLTASCIRPSLSPIRPRGLPKAASWNTAKIRAFTNYLPGFNIPMLPRELSDDLCSRAPTRFARFWPAA